MKKHILILGAGISGLSTAWYLHKRFKDDIKLTIVEKSNRVGGWIQTINKEGFLFERGPRGFRPHPTTLALVNELGLDKELIHAEPAAKRRYLYMNQKLQPITPPFLFRLGLLSVLWRERKIPPSTEEDESIESFFLRRTNRRLAETLIDPLTTGIFGGDYRKLSIRSCFSTLHEWEQQHGSIIRGMLATRKTRTKSKGPLCSFREGMETLPRRLAEKLPAEIKLSSSPEGIEADHTISCLPPPDLPRTTLTTVSLGYRTPILKKRGFGYLIPSKEKETILGVTWDSEIFPIQNRENQTRLCVILRESEDPLRTAQEALERHLGITAAPDVHEINLAKNAIPQLTVGHHKREYEGVCSVGINNCIVHAEKVAVSFKLQEESRNQ
ncbi:MAG: Protoporphyrinogen oxidase [Chlamydiae bacterium]|nr:Protoporphyrinogen oxidase [Chlamydiota bacterium]